LLRERLAQQCLLSFLSLQNIPQIQLPVNPVLHLRLNYSLEDFG
jgi:hypothetical protein